MSDVSKTNAELIAEARERIDKAASSAPDGLASKIRTGETSDVTVTLLHDLADLGTALMEEEHAGH